METMNRGIRALENVGRGWIPGKAKLAMMLKSEDLPVMCAIKPRGIGWCGRGVRSHSILQRQAVKLSAVGYPVENEKFVKGFFAI